MRGFLALAALALLASCGAEENPGGLTDEENAELNEAAAMLDSAEALPGEDALGNVEEPANANEPANAQ